MNDVLVRFTADLCSHCVGDVVRLTAAEVEEVAKEAKFLDIEQPYEVIEEAKAEVVEDDAPVEESAEVEEVAKEAKPKTKTGGKK
ncbi:hypothetical protein [Rhodococcus ruber]|uniref:hypothetical protein n=1 Tax=Rhodococcus ruber TaxID=1830 RepID=UPI001F3D0E4B|nr:hypothetical protein [Rhodococcus ruber]MCF8783201.1 hypothetical protein [Rhodococcus ruber]